MPCFTIKSLLIAVALIALGLIDARLATLCLLLVGAVAVLQALGRMQIAVPYFVALTCLYLPFSWLVLMSYPWNSYRWHWIMLWPILPGLPIGMFLHSNEFAEILVSGLVAVGLVALVTAIGMRGRKTLIVIGGLALVCAVLESWLAYQLFLS